jgi:glycosyltransferase involved in cell wall biosynthesis/peptidoglycan/xylan/chitin deacetylase (PgdA/CDA1 family)
MILAYHKVDIARKTKWYVSANCFERQLAALAGRRAVYLDDYDPADPGQFVLTFDGIYDEIVRFALPLLKRRGLPFELFVVGDYAGKWNDFDQHVEPPARFGSLETLRRLVDAGGRVQWHTRTHCRLDDLPDSDLARELDPGEELRRAFPEPHHFCWFAYPHGKVAPRVKAAAAERFAGALACDDGDRADRYNLPRTLVFEQTPLSKSTVSVIVANYNYGQFLAEALDSVLDQSVPPDEILIADDGSTDISAEVIAYFERAHPGRFKILRNPKNLGIIDNFRQAVETSTGDYIAFLGADNLMRRDYVERCKAALDANPNAAVAYTDMTIFGALSRVLAVKVGAGATQRADVFHWRFPDPTPEVLGKFEKHNFIHGSSMYRRKAYDAVGGYTSHAERPEDHNLFKRMLDLGWQPVHVKAPVIEYRQHSRDQANTAHNLERELSFWRRSGEQAQTEAKRLTKLVNARETELEAARTRIEKLEQLVEELRAKAASA